MLYSPEDLVRISRAHIKPGTGDRGSVISVPTSEMGCREKKNPLMVMGQLALWDEQEELSLNKEGEGGRGQR